MKIDIYVIKHPDIIIFVLYRFYYAYRYQRILRKREDHHEGKGPCSVKNRGFITFLTEDNENTVGKRIPGGLKGKVSLPDDFNEPLDDLNDYM